MSQKRTHDKVIKLLSENSNYLNEKGYIFNFNLAVDDCYHIPALSTNKKICILFYDHTEILKDKSVNGYNLLKEKYLEQRGYKVCRIFHKDFYDKDMINKEDEKKNLDYIIDCLNNSMKISLNSQNLLAKRNKRMKL